ncbi:MAG: acyltransferase [Bacteroidetes bacterium]|nr:acyltransferase [Bacteroidota bacterium]
MLINSPFRRSEIDFLRGIAILLVLFRHYRYHDYLYDIGWIGVDLFFVLSGFLVSGLLFKEYKKHQKIYPFHFLIRRGFKIYPIFYFFIACTLIAKLIIKSPIQANQLFGELFFLQNYLDNMWSHTWSLAIEEHFYLLLTLLIFFTSRFQQTGNSRLFFFIFIFTAISCLFLRIYATHLDFKLTNMFYSHNRFDALFFGVFISHWYHFKPEKLKNFTEKHKGKLFVFFALCLIVTPIHKAITSVLLPTIGLTFIYLGFGALLLCMLYTDLRASIPKNKIIQGIYRTIEKMGVYSYSIYLIHVVISIIVKNLRIKYQLQEELALILYFCVTIITGVLLSKMIEIPFLKSRDKYFPSKTS